MGKKQKEHKVDSMCREKADQIVSEIEAAQSQKVKAEEKRFSKIPLSI
jgi:hypothetical protein